MPALRDEPWTIEEVERLVDEREGPWPRYELVDGELLVSPAPRIRHQRILLELLVRLAAYLKTCPVGEVLPGINARLVVESYLIPDVSVIPLVNGKRMQSVAFVSSLLLAIEVLSPGSVRHDRITKRKFYQRHGVPGYWVVDGDAECFEVWRPGETRPQVLDERLTWLPEGAAEPFELDVREFFASIADEG